MEKTCENCRYFIKYYTKKMNGRLSRITGIGGCYNNNLHFKTKQKNVKNNFVCEYWEPEQLQIDERRQNICDTIKRIHRELEDIACILDEENHK